MQERLLFFSLWKHQLCLLPEEWLHAYIPTCWFFFWQPLWLPWHAVSFYLMIVYSLIFLSYKRSEHETLVRLSTSSVLYSLKKANSRLWKEQLHLFLVWLLSHIVTGRMEIIWLFLQTSSKYFPGYFGLGVVQNCTFPCRLLSMNRWMSTSLSPSGCYPYIS